MVQVVIRQGLMVVVMVMVELLRWVMVQRRGREEHSRVRGPRGGGRHRCRGELVVVLSPQQEVPRRIARVRVQMVPHGRVMVVAIGRLWRKVVMMIHGGARLRRGDVARRRRT